MRLIAAYAAVTFLAVACGAEVSGDRVKILEERIAAFEKRLGELEGEAADAPAPHDSMPTETAVPAPDGMMMENGNVQEFGLIENYAATRFFPRWMVVLKDVPVRIYLTRLHREHVNRFTGGRS